MTWSLEDSARFELELRETRAQDYDREYAQVHGPTFPSVEIRLIRRALDLHSEDVVLDLGCGTGRITEALAPRCKHVVAVDRSERSLAVLKERLKTRGLSNVTVIESDVRRDLAIDRPITKLVGVQLLQHIPSRADRSSVLHRAAEWMTTGAKSVIIDEMFGLVRKIRGRPQEIARSNALYFRTFTPHEMRETVIEAGLKPLRLLGCGVLYWSRYKVFTKALVQLEDWASFLPGAAWLAKFGAIIAIKE